MDQQANILAAVYTISVNAQLNDQRIKPATNYVIEHRNLLPSPDLSDRLANFKQLNSSLTEHFGERFVVMSCLFYLFLLKAICINLP